MESRNGRTRRLKLDRVVAAYLVVFAVLVLIASQLSSRDPGSLFFNRTASTSPRYSATRREQADAFIAQAETREQLKADTKAPPELCVGVATVARGKTNYFPTTVGSLLHGLDASERARLHVILFFAHTDPSRHPDYARAWPANVADQVLLYNGSETEMKDIQDMESEGGLFRTKGIIDYTYLLSACDATGAPYSAVVEDDAIALDGWFHRTLNGLATAANETRRIAEGSSFLYTRLFYTETYFGWNKEDWPTYLLGSTEVAWAVFMVLGLTHFATFRRAPALHSQLTTGRLLFIMCIGVPSLVALFFAAGKTTMMPLSSRNGVVRMERFGCCSQGLVFPREQVSNVVTWLRQRRVGFVDELTEQLAESTGGMRWALVPSALQHIGSISTKVDDGAGGPGTVTDWIWNYAFERHDAQSLANEHAQALALQGQEMSGTASIREQR